DQWPLSTEKLSKIQELVTEQLAAGHIVPLTSPWNTPIFTIPKKSGKWHLLHDLRAINAVMHDMGALQPGLPSLVMIPKDWNLLIFDLKDCFFTIPLHPEDHEKFAFIVPSINKTEPVKRYHWVVLHQGMKNSPTMCQLFVAWVLEPIRKQFKQLLIYHYMDDDILIAGKDMNAEEILKTLLPCLEAKGLKIALEKVQKSAPWNYLRWVITESQVKLQKITLNTEIKTLN
ncbi:POK8 protein, partial [Caloenas nicobarica]|nr:POK8 protein [Caloenas nicobarica]